MRPPGSPADPEQRRRQAIELLERDAPVHVVAELEAGLSAPGGRGGSPVPQRCGGIATRLCPFVA